MSAYINPSKTDEYSTPQDLFDHLNEEFHFNLDPCTTAEMAKCPRYYTKEDDGLTKNWGGKSLLQPSLFSCLKVGREMLLRVTEARHGSGDAHPIPDRHPMVPRLHLAQSRDQIRPWPSQIRRDEYKRTLFIDDSNI